MSRETETDFSSRADERTFKATITVKELESLLLTFNYFRVSCRLTFELHYRSALNHLFGHLQPMRCNSHSAQS